MAIGIINSSSIDAREQYFTNSVASNDGTIIGYRQFGHGPGIVLVQGTMGSAHNFLQLAIALADTFTVFVPDRRGRGLSSANANDYSTQKEVEDLNALLAITDAHNVFGLSSGAIISLMAALTLSAIHKIAIYEPPLFVNGLPTAKLRRFDEEIAQGKVAAALVTAMQAAQMGPPIFNLIPHRLLESLVSMGLKGEDKNGSGDYLPMRTLASTLHHDFQVVMEMSGAVESFGAINTKSTEVLLLGGSTSPAYLKADLNALEKVLPRAKRIEFPGLGHAASWNYDKQRNRSGNPELVAQELRQFFA